MKVKISDVAKAAGVSVATVSRVVNGQHQFMSVATRRRVEEVIKQTGYVPNSFAQGLKGHRTNTIGVLISNIAHPFWASVLDGIEAACSQRDYNVLFCNSRDDSDLEQRYIQMLQKRQVEGIIVNPTGDAIDKFFDLIQKKFPLITLDRKLEPIGIPSVGVDNVYGATLAVDHLISLGHRRIAIVLYQPNGLSVRAERLLGYKESLQKAGMPFDETLVTVVDPKIENGRELTQELLQRLDAPSAIFSTNLRVNIEVLMAIRDLGLKIPHDISVVAFDDAEWAPLLDPPLTTIATPSREMGLKAAEQMIDFIERGDVVQRTSVQMTPELIIRSSTASRG